MNTLISFTTRFQYFNVSFFLFVFNSTRKVRPLGADHYGCEGAENMYSSQNIFPQIILAYEGLQRNIFSNISLPMTQNQKDPDCVSVKAYLSLMPEEWATNRFLKLSKEKCQVLLLSRKHQCKGSLGPVWLWIKCPAGCDSHQLNISQ